MSCVLIKQNCFFQSISIEKFSEDFNYKERMLNNTKVKEWQ